MANTEKEISTEKEVVYILLRLDFIKSETNSSGWIVNKDNKLTKEYLVSLGFTDSNIKNFIDLGYIKEA